MSPSAVTSSFSIDGISEMIGRMLLAKALGVVVGAVGAHDLEFGREHRRDLVRLAGHQRAEDSPRSPAADLDLEVDRLRGLLAEPAGVK